jgi:hypothetical protein
MAFYERTDTLIKFKYNDIDAWDILTSLIIPYTRSAMLATKLTIKTWQIIAQFRWMGQINELNPANGYSTRFEAPLQLTKNLILARFVVTKMLSKMRQE